MGRKASRELAMKLLYQLDFQKDNREEQIEEVIAENEITHKEKQYILDILDGVHNNLKSIDELIEKHSFGWKLDRLSKVDLAVIRLAIFELNFRNDIPDNVAINEAIDLAKKFSSTEAGAYVNGILGKICKLKDTKVNESNNDK